MDEGPGLDNIFSRISLLFQKRCDKRNVDDNITEEDIQSLVEEGEENGIINEGAKEMIKGVFQFGNKVAEKIMTPRTDVYCIDIEDSLESYLDELLEKRYTRIPVYEGDIDNIIGVLYMKDFILEARKKGFNNINIRDILIEPSFVPECKKIKDLFSDMKDSKCKMAIIIDEYGGFSGIVTMEDLVEEIMGEINDEYEDDESDIVYIGDNSYLIEGTTNLEYINDRLGINLKDDDIDTLSGFIINLIGKIPTKIDESTINYNNIIFKMYKVSDKRIEKVILKIDEEKDLFKDLKND